MRKKVFTTILVWFMAIGAIFAQDITVKGAIEDETGEPIIGATVLVVGTSQGTITDFDGRFELQGVSQGAELKISYVGMTSQVVKAAPNLEIVLESDAQELNEVVVTALGIQRQAKAVG